VLTNNNDAATLTVKAAAKPAALAFTGSELGRLVALALAIIAAGLILAGVGRRRRLA
jgi:hypothetical protein